jgi:phosphoglycerol transferase MdoB-like AlkP superfamily enzyme
VIVLCAVGIRGFDYKSLSPVTAARHVQLEEVALATNTTFTCIHSLLNRTLHETPYFTQPEAEAEFPLLHFSRSKTPVDSTPVERPNVVVLIMESFSKEYIGFYNHGKGFTPHLDSILERSLVFDRAFANGKHSIDALSSVMLGLPALMDDSYISSPYVKNEVDGLAELIKPLGYQTQFFHGGPEGTLGFDKFAVKAGFDDYFGMEDYGHDADFDGNWGIYDEPFLQFMAREMNAATKPLCTVFFSLSSHHPFTIPVQHQARFKPTEREMEAPVRYADYALHRYFETVSQYSWYDSTVFIITADHTGPVYNEAYNNRLDHYAIPIAIFRPGNPIGEVRHHVAQQTDIAPTILDLVGYTGQYMSFGNSLVSDSCFNYCVNQMNDVFQIVSGDHVLYFDGEEVLGFYNYASDIDLSHDLSGSGMPEEVALERKLKAIIQQFRHTLITNHMTAS